MLKKPTIFVLAGLLGTGHVFAHEMKLNFQTGKGNLTMPTLYSPGAEGEHNDVDDADNNIVQKHGLNQEKAASLSKTTNVNVHGKKYELHRSILASDEVINYATSLTGLKYITAGTSPDSGFDCSGFVYHVFNEITKMKLPRSANAMRGVGYSLAKKDLRPGDLVFFNTTGRAFSHVGIYIGNDQFVHASSSARAVMISNLSHKYFIKSFNGARRVLNASDLLPDMISLNTVKVNHGKNNVQP